MTVDGLDTLIRDAFPATDIRHDQVQRVMAGVFARLDQPQPQVPLTFWRRLAQLASDLTPTPQMLVRQAMLPVALGLALGIYLGHMPEDTAPQDELMASLSDPMMTAGY
ncbi:hypothetical protein [Magnetospirillum sp. 64-120]|uniref:hypothetical protein n=1 Tax=Magnetospirillum sp. 64-120 TaxID=1895778 RepID=UPI00092C7863|nr:hypothetical protein [Magnetospirillum sp. 64-120]OJX71787.1 MAG: hypothetical protein BGO92_04120 [Magnetospirillum sp. 64-120]